MAWEVCILENGFEGCGVENGFEMKKDSYRRNFCISN